MNQVFEAALEIQGFCEERSYRFCFIGGVALQRWGEPRMTVDADMTVLTGFGSEESFIDAFLSKFEARRQGAREFALRNRVLLLKSSKGVGIDIALGALPFEERSVVRASRFQLGEGRSVLTCSAEDLIVHKAFADRSQDWADIERILIRQKGKLNHAQILRELTPLVELKEEPAILERLQRMMDSM